MSRLLRCLTLVALSSALVVPAHAASGDDLYMVKNVRKTHGVYIGDFVALRKTGKRVVGAIGAFGSEYVCVTGRIRSGTLHGTYYEQGEVSGHFTRRWHGKHIKGMTLVSRGEVRTYLESNPERFINRCVKETG